MEILAVAPEDAELLQMMVDRVAASDGRAIDFPLLSDPDHAVIDRYGLLNAADPRERGIPHPTVFVVDEEGTVRWKFVEINYKVRPTNEDILAALEEVWAEEAGEPAPGATAESDGG